MDSQGDPYMSCEHCNRQELKNESCIQAHSVVKKTNTIMAIRKTKDLTSTDLYTHDAVEEVESAAMWFANANISLFLMNMTDWSHWNRIQLFDGKLYRKWIIADTVLWGNFDDLDSKYGILDTFDRICKA
ncbi:hypothetical protein CHS0354_029961 [Potamilus streckersoni]|uniref:Uncharacterized protein n=1 Tax=Potamilus streckersoni TaxID=2493646 RepID=A0AAE0SY38_9BIVA|nr:hypothetical protein CHS0354_029961 [Potamilus streckersoni]